MSEREKVIVRLTTGSKVQEIDGTDGIVILAACGNGVNEYGIVDMVTKGGLVAAALISLPAEIFDAVIDFVKSERDNRKQSISHDNVIPFRRGERG